MATLIFAKTANHWTCAQRLFKKHVVSRFFDTLIVNSSEHVPFSIARNERAPSLYPRSHKLSLSLRKAGHVSFKLSRKTWSASNNVRVSSRSCHEKRCTKPVRRRSTISNHCGANAQLLIGTDIIRRELFNYKMEIRISYQKH